MLQYVQYVCIGQSHIIFHLSFSFLDTGKPKYLHILTYTSDFKIADTLTDFDTRLPLTTRVVCNLRSTERSVQVSGEDDEHSWVNGKSSSHLPSLWKRDKANKQNQTLFAE